jgi:hypothetical protein
MASNIEGKIMNAEIEEIKLSVNALIERIKYYDVYEPENSIKGMLVFHDGSELYCHNPQVFASSNIDYKNVRDLSIQEAAEMAANTDAVMFKNNVSFAMAGFETESIAILLNNGAFLHLTETGVDVLIMTQAQRDVIKQIQKTIVCASATPDKIKIPKLFIDNFVQSVKDQKFY